MRQAADFQALLEALKSHRVDFVVVGGVSAVLQGAPLTTYDLDVVHERSTDNVSRLIEALADLDAEFRTHPHVRPKAEHFSGADHNLMMSRLGPVDFLGEIGNGLAYDDLLPLSEELSIGRLRVSVLTLDALIDLKRQLGRDKDKWTLPLLLRTREERNEH